jgi:hypothetical protein
MKEKSKRRRFQFSVRTLLVVVTIACAAFGWLGVKIRQAHHQRSVVRTIWAQGGNVHYDTEFVDGEWRETNDIALTMSAEKFLQSILVYDLFKTATLIALSDSATDDDLGLLQELPALNGVYLHDSRITDDGLKQLQPLTRIAYLKLSDTRVTDAGLSHLYGLKQLRVLRLEGTGVTDHGCEKLREALPNLEIIR